MRGHVRAFLTGKPRNIVASRTCPPVICQQTGPVFKWHDGKDWQQGDELPAAIKDALPGPEWSRCEVHAWRRMGERATA